MVDRWKAAARQKLQHAVAEVVAAEAARSEERQEERQEERATGVTNTLGETQHQLDDVLDRLADVRDRLDEVIRRQNELEFRARRDVWYARDVRVTGETAAFVLENMPTAAVFWDPHDTLRFALGEIKGPGLALEFGVATGTTLGIIAETVAGDRTVVGFDSFNGLPETWRTGFPAGEFAQDPPTHIDGATVVSGLFEETLPAFLADNDEPIAFMHLDADLYSSTKTVLDLTSDRIAPDAVLVLDEFFNYPGWQQHEFRAFHEFIEKTGRTFEYLGYTGNNEQVVVRVH
ncbi:MAG TPA: class I SAM-dependent methyltransferase [Mycobacterium sp.]|nr:class I SAM-dependent methyltransferase [Mycobacterium sp.]